MNKFAHIWGILGLLVLTSCATMVHYMYVAPKSYEVLDYQLCTNIDHIACEIPRMCPTFLRYM